MASPEGKIEGGIGGEVVPHIKVGMPPVSLAVSHITVILGRVLALAAQLLGPVIDRVRVGVGELVLQIVAEPLVEADLQGVVKGIDIVLGIEQ